MSAVCRHPYDFPQSNIGVKNERGPRGLFCFVGEKSTVEGVLGLLMEADTGDGEQVRIFAE